MQREVRRIVLGTLVGGLALAGCSDHDPVAGLMERTMTVIEVSPSSVALSEGDSAPLDVVVRDSNGSSVEGARIVWRSRNPQVAITSAGGEVLGLSEGTAYVFASYGKQSDSVEVRVSKAVSDESESSDNESNENDDTEDSKGGKGDGEGKGTDDKTGGADDKKDPPAGRADYPNEPAGLQVIARSSMSEMFKWGPASVRNGTGSWWQWKEGDSDSSIRTESGVPGGPHFNRTRYPRGLKPGTAPVHWGAWNAGSTQQGDEYQRVYLSKRIRFVNSGRGDWESQEVGTKLGFFGVGRCGGANNELYQFLQGGTRSEFTLRFMQQNVVSEARGQNRKKGPVLKVGEWHQWEMELVLNDIGRANGIVRWWIDGDLIMEHRDMVFRTSEHPCGFLAWKWNPTWGGTGGPDKSRDDFVDISDIKISGRRLR